MDDHNVLNRFEFTQYTPLFLRQTIHQFSDTLQHAAFPNREQFDCFIGLLDWVRINLVN
ncbi:hypothetical protein D3C73_1444130 [compost metagenome]